MLVVDYPFKLLDKEIQQSGSHSNYYLKSPSRAPAKVSDFRLDLFLYCQRFSDKE
jgi:hypothetical protein